MAGWSRRSRGGSPRTRPSEPREERLVRALRDGEAEAIGELQERYGRLLSGFLRETLTDPGGAEDVRQQVLVEVWRRGPEYDPARASLLTWVMMIARSRALDERRRKRPEPVDPTSIADSAGGSESDGEVDRLLDRWRLADLLSRIPPEEAETLRLRFYEELAQPEIAERMGIPLGTVKTRMVRGLARLRDLIEKEKEPA
jgi:RNA polymerase sigma-70 factor, ECF subfamily